MTAVDVIPPVLAQAAGRRVLADQSVRNYNSGMLRMGGDIVLATRTFNHSTHRCDIVIRRIRDFATADIYTPETIVVLDLPRAHGMEHFEDARLFLHNGKIHIAYTEGHYYQSPTVEIQQLAVLREDFTVERVVTIPFGSNTVGREKNWQFFSHDGRLHFVYSIEPHVVVSLDDNYGIDQAYITPPALEFPLRGGTPPVFAGSMFVTFPHFHLPHPERSRRYAFSALCFSPVPPFAVVGVTDPIVVASANDPTLPNPAYPHWIPIVVFPCGAFSDGKAWHVSAGINDSYDVIFEIPETSLRFAHVPQHSVPTRHA